MRTRHVRTAYFCLIIFSQPRARAVAFLVYQSLRTTCHRCFVLTEQDRIGVSQLLFVFRIVNKQIHPVFSLALFTKATANKY